jgi:hypothetical protein
LSYLKSFVALALFSALAAPLAIASAVPTTGTKTHATAHHRKKPKSHKLHGQQAIEPSRVMEIQRALIARKYLTGEPNGKWDTTTIAAMQKLQADQGWQTKLMPDSRALKLLGLGPDYSGAINAKGSSFADPPPVTTIPAPLADGFAQAAGVSR